MPASYLPPAGPLLAGMRYESEQTGGGVSVPGAAPTNPSSWDVSGWAPTTYGVLGQGALAGMTLPQGLILNQAYGMTPYQQQMVRRARGLGSAWVGVAACAGENVLRLPRPRSSCTRR